MKSLKFFTLLFSALLFLISCKKEDMKPIDFRLDVTDSTFIEAIYLPKEIYNPLSIKFSYPIDTSFRMDFDGENRDCRLLYIVEQSSGSEVGLEMTVFNNDSLVIYPATGLWEKNPSNPVESKKNLYVTLEVFDKEWKKVKNTKGHIIRETHAIDFGFSDMISNPTEVHFTDLTIKSNGRFIPTIGQTLTLRVDFPIGKPVDINPYVQARLMLKRIVLKDKDNLTIETKHNVTNSDIIVSIERELPVGEQFSLDIRLAFEFKTNDSSWGEQLSWVTYKTVYETSSLINSLNDFLVEYSYPLLNQYHFFKDEYPKGYIRFSKLPEPFVMDGKKSIGGDFVVRVANHATKDYIDVPCLYFSDSLYFEYDMPSSFLTNEEVYSISLLSSSSSESLLHYYSYFFRTSMFNNLQEKFSDYVHPFSHLNIISTGVHGQIIAYEPVSEAFDYWESSTGSKGELLYNNGLLQMEILPDESSIFQDSDYKTLYDKLKEYPQALQWRTPEHMGIPPRYNTGFVSYMRGEAHPGYLTPELIEQGAKPIPMASWRRNQFNHGIVPIANNDYWDLKIYLQSLGQDLNLSFFWYLNHNLRFNVNYVLPGVNRITSSHKFNFKY